jgi:hypothetical protein
MQFVSSFAVLWLLLAVSGPKDNLNPIPVRIESTKSSLGNGSVNAWAETDQQGKVKAVGIDLERDALEGLPDREQEIVLDLPPEVKAALGVDHVGLNWNPHGHEPDGIYDRPHFDFHFYRVSSADRDRIVAADDSEQKAASAPSPHLVPADYVYAPHSFLPRMGGHWVDRHAPELHGGKFSVTYLYGFYEGELLFFEPMIAKEFLDSRQPFQMKLKAPASNPALPSELSIQHSDRTIRLRLSF